MTKKKVATKAKNDEVTCHTCKGKGTLPCGWMTLNMFVSDYSQWQDRPFYDLKKGMMFTLNGVKDPKGYYHKEYITVWTATGDAYLWTEDVGEPGMPPRRMPKERAVYEDGLLIVPDGHFAVEAVPAQ